MSAAVVEVPLTVRLAGLALATQVVQVGLICNGLYGLLMPMACRHRC